MLAVIFHLHLHRLYVRILYCQVKAIGLDCDA